MNTTYLKEMSLQLLEFNFHIRLELDSHAKLKSENPRKQKI